jgi:hypothetical protein
VKAEAHGMEGAHNVLRAKSWSAPWLQLPSLAQYATPPEQRVTAAAASQQAAAAATDTDGVHPLNQVLLSEQTAAHRPAARWGPPPPQQQQQQRERERAQHMPEWASLRQRLGHRRQAAADDEAIGSEERGRGPQHDGPHQDMQWQVCRNWSHPLLALFRSPIATLCLCLASASQIPGPMRCACIRGIRQA